MVFGSIGRAKPEVVMILQRMHRTRYGLQIRKELGGESGSKQIHPAIVIIQTDEDECYPCRGRSSRFPGTWGDYHETQIEAPSLALLARVRSNAIYLP